MSDQTTKTQETPEQLSDILLVLDKEKMRIRAVKSMDENGTMDTVAPTKKNQNQFMRVDRHGDVFSNFFSNFFSQLKNPTNFSFFKVPAPIAIDMAEQMQKQVKQPTPEGETLMKEHEVKTEQQQKQENQNNMETTQTTPERSEYRFKPEQIDWETMKNLGVSKEYLEKRNLIEPLLKGQKTNELVSISINFGGVAVRSDARLSLRNTPEGNPVVLVHGIREAPELHKKFFGHEFTDEDKKNLLETGNMGRVVDLTYKTGNTVPSIIKVDKLTKELVSVPTAFINVPDKIGGRELDETQKQTIKEGNELKLDGMVSEKGFPYNVTIQYNIDTRRLDFNFDNAIVNKQAQDNQKSLEEVLKAFRGKELTDEERDKLKGGESVFIELTDKKNQPYSGYITLNKETDKLFFEFPSKYKERVQAAEAHKTQTEVNSKGKTNEATRNINEPLKSGQQRPRNEKQQEQQNKPKAPAKTRGRKVS